MSTSKSPTTPSDPFLPKGSILIFLIGQGTTSQGRGVSSYGHCTPSRGRGLFHGQSDSRRCNHCNRTNHMLRLLLVLHGKPSWPPQTAYLSDSIDSSLIVLSSSPTQESTAPPTSADGSVILSRSECDLFIQMIRLVSTSDIASLAHS